jgi:hypothetical protein
MTGHANGVITILLREADSAERTNAKAISRALSYIDWAP